MRLSVLPNDPNLSKKRWKLHFGEAFTRNAKTGYENRSTRHRDRGRCPYYYCRIASVLAFALAGLVPIASNAYTAAGDRNFPAQLILPQIGPTDALWLPISTLPMEAFKPFDPTRQTNVGGTYSKLITEDLGIELADGLIHRDRLRASSVTGAQNFRATLQYEAILDPPHEFLLSVLLKHEFGGTGDQAAGSEKHGATTPGVTFGKGLGDLPIGYWRPLAITGFAGYEFGEGPRTNSFQVGISIQYSIPYLVSKVANVNMPRFLRGMTPITEVFFTNPVEHVPGQGTNTTLVVAPGVSYSRGRGWELGIEAMIPTTRAAGHGIGVIAQLLVQLDYLLPESVIGRPIFVPTELR